MNENESRKMPAPGDPERERRLIEAARRQAQPREEEDADAGGAGAGPPDETFESVTLKSPVSSGPAFASPPPDSFAGYQIVREIHRGGQGVVYQAIQKSTKKKVAIKVMKEGPFASAADRARFEREVQILGQLNHPNIVAIHDSGVTTDTGVGRYHYFVMDYISGQPLDVYMASGPRSIEETLKLFAEICEAVNAAHLRGVIHRDLKPGNIRIDENGEPHILDFGLAKTVLGATTNGSQPHVMTVTGQFIGSLPWASPEQAEGMPGKIDIRTDVYSLGVILYQMLTGKFPYEVIGNMRDVLDRILRAEPARPSTIRKQVNDEVETIVLKCLSKERERRYQTAGELGRDIGHYLAGEPVEAKRDSALYVLRKTLRRYRVQAVVGSAFVVLLVLASAVSTALYFGAERQRRRADAERDAAVAAKKAETREREKAAKVNEFVTKALVSSDPHQRGVQGFLVTEAMDQAIKLLDAGELKDQPETEAALRLAISQILNGNARSEEALRLAQAALEIYQQIHSGDHLDVAVSLNTVANCLGSLGRPAEALPRCQAALEMRQRLIQGDNPDVATSLNNVARCLESLGQAAEALPRYEAALAMFQRLFQGDHRDVARSLNNVAHCLGSLGRAAGALPGYQAALEMRQRLFKGDHPDVASSLNNVAACLQSLGRSPEGLPRYEAALEMYQRLFAGDHPGVATGLDNVAQCLQSLGRPLEALPKAQAALEMRLRLFQADHPDVALSQNNVAYCLQSLGRATEALPMYEVVLELYQRRFGGDHPNVATCLNNLAACMQSLGRLAEALHRFEAALEMRQRLFKGDHPDVAGGLNNVAGCLQSLGRTDEALPKYEAALAMHRRVLPPGHPNTLYPQIGLARTLVALGRYADAEPLLLDANEQCERFLSVRRIHARVVLQDLVRLYDSWDAADFQHGHNEKAAEWRARLSQLSGPASQPRGADAQPREK